MMSRNPDMAGVIRLDRSFPIRLTRWFVLAVVVALYVALATPSPALAAGKATPAMVAIQAPLVTKVTPVQPTCGVARPKLVVQTNSDLLIGYAKSRTGSIFVVTGDVPAGKYTITLPPMARGTSTSWYLVVQVLDDQPRWYGPYKFSRLSNTNCLVRAYQPTCTVSNPKATVRTEFQASIGYASSTTSVRHWVKREVAAGTYGVTFPAMARGATARWYIVVSPAADSSKLMFLGPLVFHRLSNTNCLVRAFQPTRTVANPSATVRTEGDASIGYASSKTSVRHWVKREAPRGTYKITFPAMQRGMTTRWYIVVSPLDDSMGLMFLGPLVFHRP